MMSQFFILFEHASGYALFKVVEFEEVDTFIRVQKTITDVGTFQSIVNLVSFQPFKTGRDALENINSVSEGILHPHLQLFLENNVPKSKKKHPISLGVQEPKLAAAISESLGVNCTVSGAVPEISRGIRLHFHKLVKGFKDLSAASKAELGLGHHYSRARVKFNVNRIDNMIIQSISILDQLDKDINIFAMRIREWYSHHFPELIGIVPENQFYVKCIKVIQDRKQMPEDVEEQLENILMDSNKAHNIIEAARCSMGMEISPLDMQNIVTFAERVSSLIIRRKELMEYLKSKMHSVAPNLATLIGDTVGARLIAHAGSLINLAKFPASTVQILGAEKALFRALKTRGNTPKYGLIYHSSFIGRAGKNKGRISRYLANKLSVASRIDCFREIPTEVFGEKLRQQVEDRLKFYETGEKPPKNIDVMAVASEEAEVVQAATMKAVKKAKKKEKKRMSEQLANSLLNSTSEDFSVMTNESLSEVGTENELEQVDAPLKKKKRKQKMEQEMESSPVKRKLEEPEDQVGNSPKKIKLDSEMTEEEHAAMLKALKRAKKKEKKRLAQQLGDSTFNSANEESSMVTDESLNEKDNVEEVLPVVSPKALKKAKKREKKRLAQQLANSLNSTNDTINGTFEESHEEANLQQIDMSAE